MSTMQYLVRLATTNPWQLSANTVATVAVYATPLLVDLIIREVFDALTDPARLASMYGRCSSCWPSLWWPLGHSMSLAG